MLGHALGILIVIATQGETDMTLKFEKQRIGEGTYEACAVFDVNQGPASAVIHPASRFKDNRVGIFLGHFALPSFPTHSRGRRHHTVDDLHIAGQKIDGFIQRSRFNVLKRR